MMKRTFAALLCAMLLVALLPARAFAAGATVTIGGAALPAGKYFASNGTAPQDSAPSSGGYAHLSSDGLTLSLNGFQLTNYAGQYGIRIENSSLTLDLTGTSAVSMTCPDTVWNPSGLYFCSGDTLTVQGAGSLAASVEGGNMSANGVRVENCKLLMKSGTLTGKAAGAMLYGYPTGAGVFAGSGTITVAGGTLTGAPVYGKNCESGISCGTLNVSGGTLSGEGKKNGIYAIDDMNISGGDVTGRCNSVNYGMCAYSGSIAISGGKVRADCQDGGHGIGAPDPAASVQISGGEALFTGRMHAVIGLLSIIGDPAQYTVKGSTTYTTDPTDTFYPDQLYAYESLHVMFSHVIALESPVGIALTAYSFPAVERDYVTAPQLAVTVKNQGASATGALSATFQGAGNAFTLSQTDLSSIAPGGTASFNVGVVPGLAPNTYSDIVEVAPGPGNTNPITARRFTVQITVNAPSIVETPTFSLTEGVYTGAQNVTLSCATAGATIRYTTNGNDPTDASTPFIAGTPIAITSTTILKAKAFQAGMAPSAIAAAIS